MVNLKKALEGIIETGRRRVSSSRKKKAEPSREPVKILSLSRQSDVSVVLKLARFCPVIFLCIREFREKNNDSLKKCLGKLRDDGEPDGIHARLLDENWVVVLARNTALAR